jgi:hypothetical protein
MLQQVIRGPRISDAGARIARSEWPVRSLTVEIRMAPGLNIRLANRRLAEID